MIFVYKSHFRYKQSVAPEMIHKANAEQPITSRIEVDGPMTESFLYWTATVLLGLLYLAPALLTLRRAGSYGRSSASSPIPTTPSRS